MELVSKVQQGIRRGRLLKPGDRVAVACSGGADSVALLLLLSELKGELGLRLLVAHLNHQLRGTEGDADEAFVRGLAERLGLEFIGERKDVAALARKKKLNVEEAGREARLEFFRSLLAAGKADAVATAHTLDDQAETLLARLLRGTGLTGLAGIRPVLELAKGRVIRPLLEVRRAELRDFLRQRGQEWREDATNLDLARARNRIRQELLPQLERLSPSVAEQLARLAAQAQEEEQFWEVFLEERLRTLSEPQKGAWRIASSQLLEPLGDFYSAAASAEAEAAQRAVARRLVRRLVEAVRGDTRRLTSEHVEQVLRLAEHGQSGQQVALPGVRVERSFEWLVFRPGQRRPAAPAYSFAVSVPGSVEIEATGWRFEFKLVAVSELRQSYNGGQTAALDADTLAGRGTHLTVRNWRPGDRYQPVGARRPKKLKALFARARVPNEERAHHPVVESAGRIVWAAGFGVAAACAVGERTRTALVIVEKPLEEKQD